MASRSRRSQAQAVVEEEEEQEGVRRLKFNQALVGKPGKPVGLTDLLARLKALCDELRDIEQEEAHTESLTRSAKELASPSLIQHKDAGVRAWTACCIVEMFRLFAPNAPYTASQLKVHPTGHAEATVIDLSLGHLHIDRPQDPPPPREPLTSLQ